MRRYFLIFAIILMNISWNESGAIPAFSRKYQISCQVCHSPAMPRLKGFGNDFAGNGFRLTDYESPRYFIPAGDDRLSLFRELPLAIRMDGFVTYNSGNIKTVDFGSPFVLKILSGGELSDKISYYFYFLLNERGTVAGVEDAFLVYHDLFKTGINFSIGQFQVSDPLYKGELRLTLEPYRIYDARPGNSSVDLKYDRGIVIDRGFKSGTDVSFEVLNGSGLREADERDTGKGYLFDKDKYKNLMLRVKQSITKYISLGVFGYLGKENLFDSGGIFGGITNKIQMIGPDVSINFNEKLIINVEYVWRNDSRVFPESGGLPMTDLKTNGGFAEVIFAPKGDMSKWYLTGLFNTVSSDQESLNYNSATLHAGYLLRRNVRIVSEFTWQFDYSFGRAGVGFVSAF